MVRVIVTSEIGQDGESFKDGESAAVMVDEDGDAAIWVEGCEPGFLLGVFHDVYGLVGDFGEFLSARGGARAIVGFEFFEQGGDFVAVGCAEGEEFETFIGDETCWFGHGAGGVVVVTAGVGTVEGG